VRAAAFEHHLRLVAGLALTAGGTTGPIRIELAPVAAGERPGMEIAGIGAALRASDAGLRVESVVAGGGAAAAGLAPGDELLAVDDRALAAMPWAQAVELVRGPAGTTVRLKVRRAGGETVDMKVTRALIRM
jgi:C-terminal processing protease CtpA/Prc